MIRAFWPYLPSAFRVAFRLLAQAGHAAESLGIAHSELSPLRVASVFRGTLPCESSPARHSVCTLALRGSGPALPDNSSSRNRSPPLQYPLLPCADPRDETPAHHRAAYQLQHPPRRTCCWDDLWHRFLEGLYQCACHGLNSRPPRGRDPSAAAPGSWGDCPAAAIPAPARCLKQSDLRKEAKETSNAAYRYCNSAESSAGVSPASSAISFNRHPRLFLARRRSPGFLTGRKRSVQARITGSGSHVPEPGGISGYEKIKLPKTGSLCWRSPPGRRVNFFTRTAAVPWPEPVAERASNLPPCWSSGVRRRAGFSRGLLGSCCPQPACPCPDPPNRSCGREYCASKPGTG